MVPYLRVVYTEDVKTTVEISDDLLREAKAHAARRGVSFRQVFEGSLRDYLERAKEDSGRYRFPDLSYGSGGLRPGLDWKRLHELAYDEADLPPRESDDRG